MDILLALTAVLIGVLLVIMGKYYRLLVSTRREYAKAREIVEDIVRSFGRQLKQEGQKVELIAYKVEAHSSKLNGTSAEIGEIGGRIAALESKTSSLPEGKDELISRLNDVERKLSDLITSQGALTTKLSMLEEQTERLSTLPEQKIDAVIPLKKDKALAQLTDTEVSVLELLVSEGPKTAPEIKEKVALSREHTARLMKKLYEEGYLERETVKIPFRYSVKKEMEKLLKRPESQTNETQ